MRNIATESRRRQRGFNPRREAGFNLVETLIAMALMAVVLLSVVTLFFYGRANVYSGKQMTAAISVGTRIMEDLSILSKDDVISFFALSGATIADVTGPDGKTYDDSVKITSNPMPSTPPAYLTTWNNLMPSQRFTTGKITLIFSPTRDDATAPTMANAQFLKIRVFVEWKETNRQRRIVLDTVKVARGTA